MLRKAKWVGWNPLWGWVPVTEGGECGNRVSRMGLELAVEAARVSSGGVQALEQQLPPATQLEEMPEHQEHQIMHQNYKWHHISNSW